MQTVVLKNDEGQIVKASDFEAVDREDLVEQIAAAKEVVADLESTLEQYDKLASPTKDPSDPAADVPPATPESPAEPAAPEMPAEVQPEAPAVPDQPVAPVDSTPAGATVIPPAVPDEPPAPQPDMTLQ